jgi:hypothetical protein
MHHPEVLRVLAEVRIAELRNDARRYQPKRPRLAERRPRTIAFDGLSVAGHRAG